MISLENIRVTLGGNTIFDRANLSIGSGEFVFVIGETGIGKSSFLRLLYMDMIPSTGRVRIGGYDSQTIRRSQIPYLRRTIGVVFQDFKLLADRTVFENVAFALYVTGVNKNLIEPRVHHVLHDVGLLSRERALPSDLSGGEQQRVAIARALINDPMIVLADEPTGNLDPPTSREILNLFTKIHKRGTAVIIATHDYDLLRHRPSRVVKIMNKNFFDVV